MLYGTDIELSRLTSIAIQWLVLNLRQVADERSDPDELTHHLGRLTFAHGSVLGNIGASLSIGSIGDDEGFAEGAANDRKDPPDEPTHDFVSVLNRIASVRDGMEDALWPLC